MADFFTKTSTGLQRKEKAALLYTLIADRSAEASSYVVSCMTSSEKSKLKKEIKKFTKQRSYADKQKKIKDDIFVLEEVYRFGKKFNLNSKIVKPLAEKESPKITANAEDVAKVLSRWLSEAK